ncbi:hypothetical protein [Nonomuraea sp. JJY05]|uniref:aromatic-ring hydroxylase C-terminal domain-containing protein n=1 Tax=Nonomuraea sp. JJY05 TaxID=3350255 RepID=UPI00373F7F4E
MRAPRSSLAARLAGGRRREAPARPDLLRPGRFLLVAGENGHDWCEAAAELAGTWPLDVVRVGHLDGDLLDPRSTWTRHRGHDPEGAVLVRPDRFIAWRAQKATDATARLSQALRSLLGQ